MAEERFKNRNWSLSNGTGLPASWQHVEIAVLMDIRDELQTLNRLLGCPNFTDVPTILREIRANMKKPAKRKRAKTAAKRGTR